ncbi:MAG: hypothetical protein M1445_12750 [Bacteroidetes bacterium]|nr:hypothetical protein [Bacteroidota bacterium]MCL6101006.1 hypothetical protein [Bacteroidota bacterium]
MNFTLEIKLTASPELLEAVKLIAGGISVKASAPITPASPAAIAESAQSGKRNRAAASEKTTKEVSAENVETSTEETTSEESSEASNETVTVETVRAAVQAKAQSGKRDQVKSLLTKFEVARVTDLPDTKYAKFLEEVNAL